MQTREELLNGLSEAAELEHNLACQYLFVAFSMRTDIQDAVLQGAANKWKGDILQIARQEMAHLATVSNLLTAIGGAPQFRRPNFPHPPFYYPPGIAFALERFSLKSLLRFIEFERREDAPHPFLIAPKEIRYRHVGELYGLIRDGFTNYSGSDADLFIGPASSQDVDQWGADVMPRGVKDRASAVAAIEWIISEGEGTATAGPESHYQKFFRIYNELKAAQSQNAGFDPARPVADNPLTRAHRDSDAKPVVTNAQTKDVSELFNATYATMLLMFMQYYAYGGETQQQRDTLRSVMVIMMKTVVRPLGELLTTLPATDDVNGRTAGAAFELYADMRVPANYKNSWTIFSERLVMEASEAARLRDLGGRLQPLGTIAFGLAIIRDRIAQAKPV